MELREALEQISDIRQQMARGSVFRGYRSLTVGLSGVLGIATAAIQPLWVGSPMENLGRYLVLWIGIALISVTIAGFEMIRRAKRAGSGLAREMTRLAVEQFFPCLVVGALITACIYRSAPDVAWMLPGLWCCLFGLGIFASCRLLPGPVAWGGLYFILCGCGCLQWGRGENALSPWLMAVSFGGGQLFCASILYWTLERTSES
ncbi:MAG: hypothetical protein AAGG48_29845 [Planctomycetota bacterium]